MAAKGSVLRIALVVVASMLGMACRNANRAPEAGQDVPARPAVRVVAAASDGIVIDESAAGQVAMLGCGEPPIGVSGFWVPGATDVAALEAALPAWLEAHIPPTELPRESRSIRVSRQYIGMYKAGRRVVVINGWPRHGESGKDLAADQLFMSCGGGALNFRLLFEVATKTFKDFQVNGPI